MCEPFSWRTLEDFFKILFKGGQAPAGQIPEFLKRKIEHVVFLHELCQIQLSGFFKLPKLMIQVTAALLPALMESKTGAIINISSGGSTPLPAPLLHYGAAKAALNAYSLGLAQELATGKIRVNVVTPGPVITPGADEIRKVFTDAIGMPEGAMGAVVPLGRLGQPHEVAEVVALLVSDRGQWITGHNYFVDGGLASLGRIG
jgi:NAD(P)-dependent dehydrogenase (short-subunit alcohol dehydrogenase family)